MSKLGEIGHRLYAGEVSYDFIGHRRRWYLVSAIMIAVSILSLGIRGLDFGIDKGGADLRRRPRSWRKLSTRCATRSAPRCSRS
jgi:preprotein translocase subunit SecF